MCIRDRPDTLFGATFMVLAPEHPLLDEIVPEGDWPQETNPVSYTHLRAHETVLDLVCRLLLEKKKKNTSRAGG